MSSASPDFRSRGFLADHIRRTLAFYDGAGCVDPSGGFFHFYKDDGTVYDRRTRHLVSSTRFVFNHATAWRRFGAVAFPEYLQRVRHGLDFLARAHARGVDAGDGYAWQVDWDGHAATVQDGTQHCYGLAFVLLAHAHALMAGVDEAREGLDRCVALMESRFWEPANRLYADDAAPDWTLSSYRGQNANMHGCEAMLAAWAATREIGHLERALTLAESVTQRLAGQADGLVWEHWRHDAAGAWAPDWDYNRDDRTNIFRPWGYQVGHLTEWTKLLLQLEAHLIAAAAVHPGAPAVPPWLLPTARHLFDAAMRHGWDPRHGGLVYGFAPDGTVCDGDKYFWVQAESFAAAALLALRTGDERCWDWYDRIWAYSWAHMIDHRHGAWYRIRTPDNRPYGDEKSPAGKTDYHTMGACHDVLEALGP